MIYTIGHKENYLKAISESEGGGIYKTGKYKLESNDPQLDYYPNGWYPGGYAFKTIEDAERRIIEEDKVGIYAVFGMNARWGIDTEQSESGWWHNLLHNTPIIILQITDENSNLSKLKRFNFE